MKDFFYTCTFCDFKTVYKQNLGLHMESSHSVNKETFECEQCGIKFTKKRNLTRNTLQVHMHTEVLMCQFCNFTTKFDYNLKRHTIEQHEIEGKGTGIRGRLLYTCQRCNFSTSSEHQMYTHNVDSHSLK